MERTHSAPSITFLEDTSIAQTTSSFTLLAFAPGVLKTTIPCSAQRSSGMLFTPAPALATAITLSGISIAFMSAERTRTASAWFKSSVSS